MKWCGKIGFRETLEIEPGIWGDDEIVEKTYYGDVMQVSRRNQMTDNVNDDIVISNQISIISDPYANNNLTSMAYVEFMGTKWKITNIAVRMPRLVITLGGKYNG